jgi:hypothetical protein
MKCPHCDKQAVFEAIEPMTFTPVIENWECDNPLWQMKSIDSTCMECEGRVRLDLRSKYLQAVETPLIYDDTARQILAAAKRDKQKSVPRSIVVALRQRNFKGVSDNMDGLDVVRLILQQT